MLPKAQIGIIIHSWTFKTQTITFIELVFHYLLHISTKMHFWFFKVFHKKIKESQKSSIMVKFLILWFTLKWYSNSLLYPSKSLICLNHCHCYSSSAITLEVSWVTCCLLWKKTQWSKEWTLQFSVHTHTLTNILSCTDKILFRESYK